MVAPVPTAVFIDGTAIYHMQRAVEFEVDFTRLLDFFEDQTKLLKAYYYTPIDPDNPGIERFLSYLSMTGYNIRDIAPTLVVIDGKEERRNTDPSVEIGLDAMSVAARVDQVIFITNRRTIAPIARRLNIHGIRTCLIAAENEDVSLSGELRREVDEFIDLRDMAEDISKEEKSPGTRR